MANFDTSSWYQITRESGDVQSMDGTPLFNAGLNGTVFFHITNTNSTEQQWQIFPYNSSYYVLRTHASGENGYLGAAYSVNETTPGQTVPVLRNVSVSDSSMLWSIQPFNDGTFFMTNAANGSDWHLNVKSNSLMAMSSNLTAPQAGQHFEFTKLKEINNPKFSSISVCISFVPIDLFVLDFLRSKDWTDE
jgi:hypothetical protein